MDKEEIFIKKQIEFMREIDLHNTVSISAIKRMAGVDLDTAMELTHMVITKDSHIQAPTRMADLMTHKVRKEYQ